MKKLYLFTFLLLVSNAFSQIVNIPDVNFKAYLVGNSAINTNADSEIQVSEANTFTGTINCSNLNISNLSGIEEFINITTLRCNNNQLTNLNIIYNEFLVFLDCSFNQITSLDVSQNLFLEDLFCVANQVTSLNVSQNLDLKRLYVYNNLLTNIDVSQNILLYDLRCFNNSITSLNLDANPDILTFLCLNNQLTSLSVQNGNNGQINWVDFTGNPNLTCILVDDATYSTANWTNVDPASTFVNNQTECNLLSTNDYELNEAFVIYPNPAKSNISIHTDELIDKVEVFDLFGKKLLESNSTKISIQDLQAGVYLIKIDSQNKTIIKKIIKQ